TRQIPSALHLVSFDHTLEPVQFALQHTEALEYLTGYESRLEELIVDRHLEFKDGEQQVQWDLHVADFPTLLRQPYAQRIPKPHVIMFDAFSPAKNPAMWTQPLFADLLRLLDPKCPCVLPTY